MSYPEKKSLFNMFSSVIIFVIYSVVVYQKYLEIGSSFSQDTIFWATAFFILIPVSIVAQIIIQIIYSIIYAIRTKEKEPINLDEFDKVIELKATKFGHWIMVFGVMISVATLVFGATASIMVIVLSFMLLFSSLAHDIAKFVLYRKGV